jgi:hypothetical protein
MPELVCILVGFVQYWQGFETIGGQHAMKQLELRFALLLHRSDEPQLRTEWVSAYLLICLIPVCNTA